MHEPATPRNIEPVIITLAPVDYTDPRDFPSARALAGDICESHAAGAAVVHFHVTDAQGRATADTAFFDEVVSRVRNECDIIIQGSTGGVGIPWEVRTAAMTARGLEMASLNMGSCNLFGRAYVNTPQDIAALAARMYESKVTPDMCFFEPGFFSTIAEVERAANESRLVTSICLGFPGALSASVENLVFMISKLPPHAVWTLVHHGSRDFALLAAAIAAGGSIRVGFEDSRELGGGVIANNNVELVARACALVEQLGRRVATAADARQRYGIGQKRGRNAENLTN